VFVVACASRGREGKELAEIGQLVEAGAVAFSDDGAPVYDAELMRRVFEYCRMFDKPFLAHEEVLAELSNVTGMALCNALTRSAELRSELEKNRARVEEMRRIKEERMFREAERLQLQTQDARAALSEDQSNNGRDATPAI
jgi:dihydroorotase-like cyclic amidohydrolase